MAGPSAYFLQNKPHFDALIAHYQAQLGPVKGPSSGQTIAFVAQLNWADVLVRFVAAVQQMAKAIGGPEAERRQAVLDAVVAFYRQSFKAILVAASGHPFIFNTVVNPGVERLINEVASGVYDAMSRIFDVAENSTPTQAAANTVNGHVTY